MHYLKKLFFQFLVVFFAVHILPGIVVVTPTKLPHMGGDLIVSAALGFFNSLIYPAFRVLHRQLSVGRAGALSLLISLVGFGLLKFVKLGVDVESVEGYIFVTLFISCGSTLINYVEMKHTQTT